MPTTQTLTTKLPATTNQHTETEVVSITYTGGGQTFTTYLTQSGEICDETVTLTITTTCPLTTVAPGGQLYTTTVTVITTHTVYPDDWEDDGYEGEDNAGGSASGSSDDGEWEWYEEDDGECVPTGGSSSGSGTGSLVVLVLDQVVVLLLDPVLVLVQVIPVLLQLLVDRLEAGGVDLVTIMFALVKMATMMKMIKLLNQSVTMRMIAGMMMKSVIHKLLRKLSTRLPTAESIYPSITAASLTTSWISTQTAQSVTQIENIGGKVSASGLLLFLGCC